MRLLGAITATLFLAWSSASGVAQDAPVAGDFKTGWNTWSDTKAGEWVEYAMLGGRSMRYELKSVAENGQLVVEKVEFEVDGKELTREQVMVPVDKAHGLSALSQAADPDSKWRTEVYEVGKSSLNCNVCSWEHELAGEFWLSPLVPCSGVVKIVLKGEDFAWITAYARNGKVVEFKKPAPPVRPENAPLRGYGEAITMALPEKVRKQIQDQGTAITRLRLYFEDEKGAADGAKLEFESMYTEVPVIYAAFDADRCDKLLSYNDWLAREGRYVDLGFAIKTRPKALKGLEVRVEHIHLTGETETRLSTFNIRTPDPGEPWDSLRLQGVQPGINRYALVVSYTNAAGETTTQRGFSHWVIVNSPPMFEFVNEASAIATRTLAGGAVLLDAEVRLDGNFLLHHGLNPKDCSLRIARNGRRQINLEALTGEVRRAVAKDAAPAGWQELGRCKLPDGMIQGNKVVTVEDSFVRVTFKHGFSASSNVLPVTEDWEYRFELLHTQSARPLATWTARIDLKVSSPADIDKAKLRIAATGLEEPLEVTFERK